MTDARKERRYPRAGRRKKSRAQEGSRFANTLANRFRRAAQRPCQSNAVPCMLQLVAMMNYFCCRFFTVPFPGTGGAAAAAHSFIFFLQAAVKVPHQIGCSRSDYNKYKSGFHGSPPIKNLMLFQPEIRLLLKMRPEGC